MAVAVHENKVTKKEFIVYIVILAILSLLDLVFTATMRLEYPLMRYVFYSIFVLGFFIPFIVAFIANRQGDNHRFWYRFISISVAIVFLLSFFTLIASILYTSLIVQPANNSPSFSWDDILVGAIAVVVGSIMIYRYMRIASSAPAIK